MKKELGTPTRKLFFARLAEVAPDFRRCSTYDIKGSTWSFLRRRSNLNQWLWFQRHKYEDAFTVELSWSCVYEDPARPRFGSPSDQFTPEGCRFRLGAFWEPHGDFWWYVADPDPHPLTASPKEFVEALLRPRSGNPSVDLPRIHAVVEDALARFREHAIPYFDRVAEWASQRE